jgi:hypothetical protein
MRERRISFQRIEFCPRDFECDRSLQLATQNPAQATAQRREIPFIGRLDDDANAIAGDVREIGGERRRTLSMRTRGHERNEAENDSCKDKRPAHDSGPFR